jgi:hypothetical protein
MRTNHLLYGLLVCSSILFLANSSGAPLGRTGAPGDNTCGSSSCHNVSANQENATIAINFGEEATTYQAGETYQVNISITDSQNPNRNGFQIVALDEKNENVGAWILTNDDQTQTRSSNSTGREYVTHTRNGNSQSTWSMNWAAPVEDAGAVTFYLAVLDANGANGNRGDHLYTTSQTINADIANSTWTTQAEAFRVFPMPAKNVLNIQYETGVVSHYALYDLSGHLLRRATYQPTIEISDLLNGLYILKLETNAGQVYRKVMVQR